jgi:uncharacterized membrane protein YGL010W
MKAVPVAMNTKLAALFGDYAENHRHPVNVRIHKIAIPLIVFHILAMLSWIPIARVPGTNLHITVALVGYVAVVAWYLTLDVPLGLCMAALFGICFPLAWVTPWPVVVAVAVIGWTIQLLGHVVWEKKQPAFVHNLVHALVGPLYFVATTLGRWPVRQGA